MKVLSLFDGISCARVALDRLGIKNVDYHASEIDRPAMHIAMKNWPDTLQVGDVTKLDGKQYKGKLDLLIGGSPCQDLSVAKNGRQGLAGARSGLFYEYVRILREAEPKYFVLENVASMPKEARDEITRELGVEPIMIDATLVSAQRRKRLFWTNIKGVKIPEDRGIFLRDVLEDIPADHPLYELKDKSKTLRVGGTGSKVGDRHEWDSVFQWRRTYMRETKGGKVPTLTANMGTGGHNVPFVIGRPRGKFSGGNLSADGKAPTVTSSGFEDNTRVAVALTERRTAEAKRIRKEHMAHGRDFSPRRGKELVPRTDGKANTLTTGVTKESLVVTGVNVVSRGKEREKNGKSYALKAGASGSKGMVAVGIEIRKLTPIECERLQSLPDNYTECVSNTQRYKALGNAFNAKVVEHILSFIKR